MSTVLEASSLPVQSPLRHWELPAKRSESSSVNPTESTDFANAADLLRTGLHGAGYDTGLSSTHIVPAIVGDGQRAMALADRALEQGIYAQGIRYPSVPVGAARIRFTPSAGHTEEEIAQVVDVFAALREAV